MRSASPRSLLALLALALAEGCGGSAPAPALAGSGPPLPAGSAAPRPVAAPAPSGSASALSIATGPIVSPSMLLPDLVGDRGLVSSEEGYRRVLRDRMRLIVREDGSLERAAELIGTTDQPITSIELPSRLGGGFLFYVNVGGGAHGAGTQIYRAKTWLGKLAPLAQLSVFVSEIIPGFDRLYLRVDVTNRLRAIDPDTGRELPLGPLPPASAYGPLAFADGWRAVVDADLRGPLATFDAGVTWLPIAIPERIAGAGVLRGDPVFVTPTSAQYVVDAHGTVTLRSDPSADDARGSRAANEAGAPGDPEPPPVHPTGPLGRRPLRAAIEDGWPDGEGTAVVARGGALARVSLKDGSILALAADAYPETLASCHAVPLGRGFGFVCGERDGATSIYAFEAPLAMRRTLRFARPRFVASSGNGALVVRGSCADDVQSPADAHPYCIVGVDGRLREIRVKGDLGVERVVALADGRIAVLAPPRAGGTAGQLTIIRGSQTSTVPLAIPLEPKATAREVKRGMWLEGFEEREPGVLGGWVEAGGPIFGVRVALDGKVTMGEVRDSFDDRIVMGGRFALAELPEGRGAETVDGGMSWSFFEMPTLPAEDGSPPTRACGPVGCALERWLRVGWGRSRVDADFAPAESPAPLYAPLKTQPTLAFRCDPTGSSAGPPADKPTNTKASGGQPKHIGRVIPPRAVNAWLTFRGVAAPALAKDEIGLDNGASYDTSPLRAYAWGRKGADWSRSGRWVIRFDDRFDPSSGVRTSAVTSSPWPDEAAASEALGTGPYTQTQWVSFPDPGGHATLAEACRGVCAMYVVTDGQPILAVRDTAGRVGGLPRVLLGGAVRVGETWLFAAQTPSQRTTMYGPGPTGDGGIAIYRIDLGVARLVTTLSRPVGRPGASPPLSYPRLVRRAFGAGAGVLIESADDPNELAARWYVLPIDTDTGDLGEPILLGRRDFGGQPIAHCAPKQDGWLFESFAKVTTNPEPIGGTAQLGDPEYRLRMDPGSVCVDALAKSMDGTFTPSKAPARASQSSKQVAVEGEAIPLAATEHTRNLEAAGRRWGFSCRSEPRH